MNCCVCHLPVDLSYHNLFSLRLIHDDCKRLIESQPQSHYYHYHDVYLINDFYFENKTDLHPSDLEPFIYASSYRQMSHNMVYLFFDNIDDLTQDLTMIYRLSESPLIIISFYALF